MRVATLVLFALAAPFFAQQESARGDDAYILVVAGAEGRIVLIQPKAGGDAEVLYVVGGPPDFWPAWWTLGLERGSIGMAGHVIGTDKEGIVRPMKTKERNEYATSWSFAQRKPYGEGSGFRCIIANERMPPEHKYLNVDWNKVVKKLSAFDTTGKAFECDAYRLVMTSDPVVWDCGMPAK